MTATRTVVNTDQSAFTELSYWWREQPELDSFETGYRIYNVDFMVRDRNTNKWVLIEEKAKGGKLAPHQKESFEILNAACKNGDPLYRGFWLVRFLGDSIDDGVEVSSLDGSYVKRESMDDFKKRVIKTCSTTKEKKAPPRGGVSELTQRKEAIIANRYG